LDIKGVVKLKAVILAGGFATRLRPLSCTRPKTLFPLVNKPLLQWIFERLKESDVSEAILAVNRLTAFYIKQHTLHRHGLHVKFSYDPPRNPLGTAGPIKHAEKLIGQTEPFLVLNGDIFADLSYKEIIESHVKRKAWATLALYKVEDPSRYGVAELAADGRITRFVEKPPKGTAPSNLINAGVYVLSPEVLQLIPKGKGVSMEREIFPKLAAEGKLYGHRIKGLWMDVGKPDEYLETNRILLDALFKNEKHRIKSGVALKKPVALDKKVTIGEKSVIGPYAVLGENVAVGKNVKIKDSVIFPTAQIGDSANIEGAIIGEGAVIGENVKIGKGCIVADQAVIKPGVQMEENVVVCPAKEVGEKMLKCQTIR
jgi:mannose-1-phosphate guanylyltransferase